MLLLNGWPIPAVHGNGVLPGAAFKHEARIIALNPDEFQAYALLNPPYAQARSCACTEAEPVYASFNSLKLPNLIPEFGLSH